VELTGPHPLLVYEYVPDMSERRAPHREGHLALIAAHKADGRILLAGAVGDPPRGGLLVFRPGEDPQAFIDADPYVAAGLVVAHRVEPWTLV
jgi:uncharacterized protein YciI